ncbi:MAG: hypothetical protein J6A48_03810, partial [Clostridia bacterium]|nr:hypothetical protein [Clostridia bacterium]
MHKIKAFAVRNGKEILRDPLSYIFCLGFPLVMLVIMTLVDRSIPAQAGMTIFHIENLSGGIMVFGLTFVMLFTAITVAWLGKLNPFTMILVAFFLVFMERGSKQIATDFNLSESASEI